MDYKLRIIYSLGKKTGKLNTQEMEVDYGLASLPHWFPWLLLRPLPIKQFFNPGGQKEKLMFLS